jgi:hypothetical protein
MPQIDGELKSAQLEEISGSSTTPAARSRIYSDKTDTAATLPTFHNGTAWRILKFLHSPYSAKTTTATLTLKEEVVTANANSAAFTITLPTAVGNSGKVFIVKKIDSTFNAVTIDGNASETIEGSTTTTLNTQNECLTIVSDGANWRIVERHIPSVWTAFTPTGTWIANTTYYGYWRRVGDSIDLDLGLFLGGAPTSASLAINHLPGSLAMDTAKMIMGVIVTAFPGMGPFGVITDNSASDRFICTAISNATTSIDIYKDDGDGTLSIVNATAPVTFATQDAITIKLNNIPIVGWNP